MERSNFFTDQDVLQEDLNNIETTKGNQLKFRAQYILGASGGVNQGGIFTSASVERSGIYFSISDIAAPGTTSRQYFIPSALSSTSIRILEGKALDPNGEIIRSLATIDMTKGATGANYDWSTPGLGIPQIWYVKLKYAAVSGSIKSDDLGISFPTRFTDDFIINVDYTPPASDEILLSSFGSNSSGDISGSIVDERSFVRVQTAANAVLIDPSIAPVGSHFTAEDHITAVGTGIPTPTNPHGLAPDDIGISNDVEPHRKEAHTPGIVDITGEYPDTAAFRDSHLGTPTDIGADVEISWTSANSNAAMMVKGLTFTPTLVTLSLVNHPDMIAGGDTIYWLYFDNTTAGVYNVRASTTNLDDYKTGDRLLLAKIQRISGGSEFSGFEDLRRFYGTSQASIAGDIDEDATFDTLNLVSSLKNNLNRIRYQLGLSLSGVGASWAGSNPLTAGTVSSGDPYHTHSNFPAHQIFINTPLIIDNPGYLIKRKTGEIAGVLLHTLNPANATRMYFVTNYTGGGVPTTAMKATGSFAAIEVDGDGTFGGNVSAFDGTFNNILVNGSASVVGNVEIGGNPITPTQAAGISILTDGPGSNADALHTHDFSSYRGPETGSMIPTYVDDTTRQNIGSASMFVSAILLSGGASVPLNLYVTEISGSYGDENRVGRVSVDSAEYGSLFGVVPPNFYYKVRVFGSITTLEVHEFPPTAVDA